MQKSKINEKPPAPGHAQKWPANRVFKKPLKSLVLSEKNARTHSEDQVKQIAASMREWGWTNPVLVDENMGVIAGHGRIMAARLLGLEKAPVMIAEGWSDDQKRAYMIADNQLALNAGWDQALLKGEVADLVASGFDIGLTGLDNIDALLAGTGGSTEPDDIPAPPETPITEPGDIWHLGKHRLVCGDSTDAETVALAIGHHRPLLMVTDPPYGVYYDPDWRLRAGVSSHDPALGKVLNDHRADWREAWDLFPGDVAYVWHGGLHLAEVAASLQATGFKLRCQIIWVKTRPAISRGHYNWQHEPACYAERSDAEADDPSIMIDHEAGLYGVRAGKTAHWAGDQKQSSVWFIEHIKSETGHSTQKPVECMSRPMTNNSVAGDCVYDPFLGSGTTLIAAEMHGRICIGIELSPCYCDVIINRWQNFTGLVATNETRPDIRIARNE